MSEHAVSHTTEAAPSEVTQLFEQIASAAQPMKGFKKLDERSMNGIYTIAYRYYQSGRYAEAVKLFQWLCISDYSNVTYFKALAATQFMLKEYAHAVTIYSLCYVLDENNPEYPFQSGMAHLAMGNLTEAESGFYAASLWGDEKNSEHVKLNTKAQSMLELVRKKKSKTTVH